MRLTSFRIKNFRSILDTGIVRFSPDNVTVLVGQNESGKTAVLEALSKTLSSDEVVIDDLRHDEPLPEIWISTQWTEVEIADLCKQITNEVCRAPVVKAFKENNFVVNWIFKNTRDSSEKSGLDSSYEIDNLKLRDHISSKLNLTKTIESVANAVMQLASPQTGEEIAPLVDVEKLITTTITEVENALWQGTPEFVLFDEQSGLLPDRIEITEEFKLQRGSGFKAAGNFLAIAGINLKALVQNDTRARAATLKKANKQITEKFLEFWSQNFGSDSKLQMECSIHHHALGHADAGKSYLEFLIADDSAALYPKQRSRGTRWFISFFLQLCASQIENENTVFLLDEPGANLHEKAQDDVLTLIENIREKIGIVYSTHSPHLINEKFFHRILAIERDPKHPAHPTKIIGAHALGAASTDTLSPIFTAMGVSLSRQTSIKSTNNVILEELSSYYYLKAFWKLTNCDQSAYFLPATGTSNVITFAQLFLGWGLEFIAVVDDEPSGRNVYKTLKRDMFADDDVWASKRLLKITGCEGIEDIFDPLDYKNYVLDSPEVQLIHSNAKWAKVNGAAKAIHALKFLQKVERSEIRLDMLQEVSRKQIQKLVEQIATRLRDYEA